MSYFLSRGLLIDQYLATRVVEGKITSDTGEGDNVIAMIIMFYKIHTLKINTKIYRQPTGRSSYDIRPDRLQCAITWGIFDFYKKLYVCEFFWKMEQGFIHGQSVNWPETDAFIIGSFCLL